MNVLALLFLSSVQNPPGAVLPRAPSSEDIEVVFIAPAKSDTTTIADAALSATTTGTLQKVLDQNPQARILLARPGYRVVTTYPKLEAATVPYVTLLDRIWKNGTVTAAEMARLAPDVAEFFRNQSRRELDPGGNVYGETGYNFSLRGADGRNVRVSVAGTYSVPRERLVKGRQDTVATKPIPPRDPALPAPPIPGSAQYARDVNIVSSTFITTVARMKIVTDALLALAAESEAFDAELSRRLDPKTPDPKDQIGRGTADLDPRWRERVYRNFLLNAAKNGFQTSTEAASWFASASVGSASTSRTVSVTVRDENGLRDVGLGF